MLNYGLTTTHVRGTHTRTLVIWRAKKRLEIIIYFALLMGGLSFSWQSISEYIKASTSYLVTQTLISLKDLPTPGCLHWKAIQGVPENTKIQIRHRSFHWWKGFGWVWYEECFFARKLMDWNLVELGSTLKRNSSKMGQLSAMLQDIIKMEWEQKGQHKTI